jgi:hypothetical protein
VKQTISGGRSALFVFIGFGGKQIRSLTHSSQSEEECGIINLTLRKPEIQADKE